MKGIQRGCARLLLGLCQAWEDGASLCREKEKQWGKSEGRLVPICTSQVDIQEPITYLRLPSARSLEWEPVI